MPGKDILTLLLVIYNFKDIKITTYRGAGNSHGYEIRAYNKIVDEFYYDENCEGLLFNITQIINWMEYKNIKPTYSPFSSEEYSVKEILKMFNNDENKKE